jgi:AraC-like DNA-binding protein
MALIVTRLMMQFSSGIDLAPRHSVSKVHVDEAQRLRGAVLESLDQEQDAKGLARQAYRSRTQFYRLFGAMIEETPVAMRRRLLLERAAWQLSRTQLSVTEIRADAEFHGVLTEVRNRRAWDDTFVDALCEPPETFTFGGMFAHVITFTAHRRMLAMDALRDLGIKVEGFGCPSEYVASLVKT